MRGRSNRLGWLDVRSDGEGVVAAGFELVVFGFEEAA
jgi:hypothetical protein